MLGAGSIAPASALAGVRCPSPSPRQSPLPLYETVRSFVAREDPGAVLVPTISPGFCDMHFLHRAFGTVAYGFWPVRHTHVDV